MPKPFPLPPDEEARLRVLHRYGILDTGPEPQFDRISEMARRRFGVPIALVAFMDADRNFLKARGDLPMSESPREISFCTHTILTDEVLVIPDAAADPRFRGNPLVTTGPGIRFYAGAPLITSTGHRVGTVCVFDTRPRPDFGERERLELGDLAGIVADHLEMRLVLGNVHDEIQTRRVAEAEARRIAMHDTLTGLPNRAHLQRFIAAGVPTADAGGLAAFAADIDDFKTVNDTLGHFAGDTLLCRTANLISRIVGSEAFVARVSGDEFVIVLQGPDGEAARALAAELVQRTREPMELAGHRVSTGVSVGVAVAETSGADINTLLLNADLALRDAKLAGRGTVAVFSEGLAVRARRRATLAHDLPGAIRSKAIEVLFQPIHQAPEGHMIGVEALARWSHPRLGSVGPVEFIRLAEETGDILALGANILRAALAQARDWEHLFVSVNLSPVEFRLADLSRGIADALAETGFPARRLQLEVTEGVLLHDIDAAQRQMQALRQLGVHIALDDFGVEYSSLRYLSMLPFDKIKIDRSFCHGVAGDPKRLAIVRHIIALARELEMRVTAEGVENEADALLLAAAGCNSFQGYLFGKAMSPAEICARLGVARRLVA